MEQNRTECNETAIVVIWDLFYLKFWKTGNVRKLKFYYEMVKPGLLIAINLLHVTLRKWFWWRIYLSIFLTFLFPLSSRNNASSELKRLIPPSWIRLYNISGLVGQWWEGRKDKNIRCYFSTDLSQSDFSTDRSRPVSTDL